MSEEFTPSETMLIEVLQARMRLGETLWTVDHRMRNAANSLQDKGFIHWEPGNVEKTIRIFPRPTFTSRFVSSPYDSPAYRKLIRAARLVLERSDTYCSACVGTRPSYDGHSMNPPCAAATRELLNKALEELDGRPASRP